MLDGPRTFGRDQRKINDIECSDEVDGLAPINHSGQLEQVEFVLVVGRVSGRRLDSRRPIFEHSPQALGHELRE